VFMAVDRDSQPGTIDVIDTLPTCVYCTHAVFVVLEPQLFV